MDRNQDPSRRRAPRRSAFTLTEVLLALTVTTLIGLAVVTMLSAASYGSTSRAGMRDLLVLSKTTAARIGLNIRTAIEVVGVDGSTGEYIVLWVADTNDDGTRQRGEMQLIERIVGTNELHSYTNSADSTNYTTMSNFRTQALASYTSERWATGITDVTFTLVAPPTDGSALVNYRVTATRQGISDTSVGAVAVRNATPAP